MEWYIRKKIFCILLVLAFFSFRGCNENLLSDELLVLRFIFLVGSEEMMIDCDNYLIEVGYKQCLLLFMMDHLSK